MKARLTLLMIFLVTFAMAGVLYYVMKHSTDFRSQSENQMRSFWVQNLPGELGPYEVQGHKVSWKLRKQESDWSFKVEGEELIVQPVTIDMDLDAGAPRPVEPKMELKDLKTAAWTQVEPDLRAKLSEVLKIKNDPAILKVLSPASL